jgi:hypothetical protein
VAFGLEIKMLLVNRPPMPKASMSFRLLIEIRMEILAKIEARILSKMWALVLNQMEWVLALLTPLNQVVTTVFSMHYQETVLVPLTPVFLPQVGLYPVHVH